MLSRVRRHDLTVFTRYLVCGAGATLLHWAVMWLLVAASVSASVATAAGALAGALLNYFLQFHFTFRSDQAHHAVMPRYLFATVSGWLVNNAAFAFLHGFVLPSVALAQLLTTLLVLGFNFVINRRFVFNERND